MNDVIEPMTEKETDTKLEEFPKATTNRSESGEETAHRIRSDRNENKKSTNRIAARGTKRRSPNGHLSYNFTKNSLFS